MNQRPVTVKDWRAFASDKSLSVLHQYFSEQLQTLHAKDPAWIHICTPEQLKHQFKQLETLDAQQLPLFGVPFAVKDNIDIEGWVTTKCSRR